MSTFLTILDLVFGALGVYIVKQLLKQRRLPLPPGPRGYPFIGNMLDMPKVKESEVFTDWRERYGDIIYLNLVGQPMIILNSPRLAFEMLDKKSSIYSDRPRLEFGGEMVGWDQTLVLSPYGDRFREYRRFMHQLIGGRNQVKRFHPLSEQETQKFLRRLMERPDEVRNHIRYTAGSLILQMSHGYAVQEGDDPYVDLVEYAVDQFSQISRPGAFLVDIVPLLRYIPSWFPGAGFKRQAQSWRKTLNEMVDVPYDFVKRRMDESTNVPNYTSDLLENEKLVGDKEHNIKWSAASLYSGGADTTVSANYSFFLAMTLYPEAQRKAQEELDRVIGTDRLPTFADRGNLPYVEALVTEVFRWNPVVPLGAPHRLLEDDVHAGYFIPKGSIVIANVSGFLHDPEVYEDPFNFLPERFLHRDGKTAPPDSRNFCFGFGRRICPGLHFADASVWILCAMTLAAFKISKAVENGEVIEPTVEYTTGTISHPHPFKCSVKPRSAKVATLVLSEDTK